MPQENTCANELHPFLCRVLQVREETIGNPPESVSDTSSARFASHCLPRRTSVTWVYPLNTYPLDSKYATLISVSTSDELHPEKLKKKSVNVTVLVFIIFVQESLLRQLLFRMLSHGTKRKTPAIHFFILAFNHYEYNRKFPEATSKGEVTSSQCMQTKGAFAPDENKCESDQFRPITHRKATSLFRLLSTSVNMP